MARFNFEDYEKDYQQNKTSGNGDFKVKFFKLGDGETKVVRFPYQSASEFDTINVHVVQEDGKFRKINCKRSAYEPVEKCPLCMSGNQVKSRFLAKVLYYEQDNGTGTISPKAGVWDAPLSVARQLRGFINEYGNISEILFKITRVGEKLNTTYTILPANMAIYKPEIYVPDFRDFNDLKLENRFYFEKTPEEMSIYLSTGKFPVKERVESNEINVLPNNIPIQQPVQAPVSQVATIPTAPGYVIPNVGVEEPITPAQAQAQNIVLQQPVNVQPSGRRYSY